MQDSISNNIAADIASRLAQQAETFTAYLLPNGKRDGAHWIVGSINGEEGQSLKVTLTGEKVGKWIDYADDTQHGDLLDLWAAVRSISLSDALREAKDYLGLCGTNYSGQAYKPAPQPPKSPETPEQATQRREKDARKREKAKAYWDKGKPCTSHPYLIRKDVKSYGLRVLNGDLLIPIYDDDWKLISVQIIQPDGTKRFLKGCKMAGGRFPIGKVTDNTLIIAEGYATAASIHQATGLCIAVAFSSGNLPRVAAAVRKKKPKLRIILAPDNDDSRHAIKTAEKAALSNDCDIWVPQFPKGEVGTDFNDLQKIVGLDEIKRQSKSNWHRPEPEPAETAPGTDPHGSISLGDFRAYMPDHRYIFEPTRETWPATSVDARLEWPTNSNGTKTKPSKWLDKNAAVEQMTWAPGLPMLIRDKLVDTGGWINRKGCTCFNLYRPPTLDHGNAEQAGLWIEHVRKVYPDDFDHIVMWFAHRVQKPHEKINHSLDLGGKPGIGKDTMLEPVKQAVGPWNCQEVAPGAMLGRFNAFVKSVILRVSEARDLGDVDRFAFYDHTKTIIAAPPDVIRVDEKYLREYPVPNVCGVVITTNYKTNGLYLPEDDRRHYVAWSELPENPFDENYWDRLWQWYCRGGFGHVAAYLAQLDISGFNPKAPPKKTEAFWHMVNSNRAPEDAELADVLDRLRWPAAITLDAIKEKATQESYHGFAEWLGERKNRRKIPHRLEAVGYEPVRNQNVKDGLWKIGSKRQMAYAKTELSICDRIIAAEKLT